MAAATGRRNRVVLLILFGAPSGIVAGMTEPQQIIAGPSADSESTSPQMPRFAGDLAELDRYVTNR